MTSVAEYRQGVVDLESEAQWSARDALAAIQRRIAEPQEVVAVTVEIIDPFEDAAGALAADWYDEVRSAAGIAGAYGAAPTRLPEDEVVGKWLNWCVKPLSAVDADAAARAQAMDRLRAMVGKIVGDTARQTVMDASIEDPSARGWRRVGSGSTCSFCRMILARGAVFREATATFKSHLHCKCQAVPSWDDAVRVDTVEYRRSTKSRPDEDRAHLRAYLRANF